MCHGNELSEGALAWHAKGPGVLSTPKGVGGGVARNKNEGKEAMPELVITRSKFNFLNFFYYLFIYTHMCRYPKRFEKGFEGAGAVTTGVCEPEVRARV